MELPPGMVLIIAPPKGRPAKAARKPARITVGRTARGQCRWEGEVVEQWRSDCAAKAASLSLRLCDHPGYPSTCRRGVAPAGFGAVACVACPLYEPPGVVRPSPAPARPYVDGWTRHLLFHVYPVGGNGAWQRNVSRLVERLRLFNGKVIVAIATDPLTGRKPDPTGPHPPDKGRHFAPCDDVETVKAAFGEWRERVEFLVVENDPHLREGVSFLPMMERLPNEAGHCYLYAQAKGTTRRPSHIAHRWNEAQFVVYLDYWPLVAEQLATFPVTGAFKKLGPGWKPEQAKSDWHYSGSWWWGRTADLFARDWRTMDQFWSTIEPYPSQKFLASEAGTLFHEAAVPAMNLYSPRYWRAVVDPALAAWRKANVRYFNGTNGL